MAFLLGALTLQHNTLQFFKDDKLLVGVINLGIALFFANQKTSLLEPLKFALNIAGIFLDQLCQAANVRLEIRIFSVNHNDLTPHSGGNKNI